MRKTTMSNQKLGTSIIRDVKLNYVFIDEPRSPFGTEQWECQIEVDPSRKAELETYGKVRTLDNGNVAINLKRKAFRKDGTENTPVVFVDSAKKPIDSRKNIGNGSEGNVKVFRAEYNVAGRSGITTILSAIQMTNLVEYTGSVDFDNLGDDTATASVSDDDF